MWMASDFGLAFDGGSLPQSTARLGIHVGAFVRHLFQLKVADVVESKIANRPPSVAFGCLSLSMARHGCRNFS